MTAGTRNGFMRAMGVSDQAVRNTAGAIGAHVRGASVRAVRRGKRTVLLTEEWPRFGNFMYFWLHAFVRQREGGDYRVLANDSTSSWLSQMPKVRQRLCVSRDEVRIWDQREWPSPPEYFQRFGSDFDAITLDGFIREMVLGSPLMLPSKLPRLGDQAVINVRRGDYYSDLTHRENFGFDIEPYLREALGRAFSVRSITGVVIVSDDIPWCQANVDHIARDYSGTVRYAEGGATPEDDFRTISCARTLICANSTFSYWGGYVSTVMHGSDAHVLAPDFHARKVNEGAAYQLHDRWDIVPVME